MNSAERNSKLKQLIKPSFNKNQMSDKEAEKSYLLTDILKNGGCVYCINKNCKIKEQHGLSFPSQFCNYVKNPTYIEDVQKSIANTELFFYGKKPFFVICKFLTSDCPNCRDLRLQFVDFNGSSFAVCCGKPSDSDTITVGVHVDLKLILNQNRFRIMAIPLEINYDKLVKDFEEKQSLKKINKNTVDSNVDSNNIKPKKYLKDKFNNNNTNNLKETLGIKNNSSHLNVNTYDNELNELDIKSEENENDYVDNFPLLSPVSVQRSNTNTPISFKNITDNLKDTDNIFNDDTFEIINDNIINDNEVINEQSNENINNKLLDEYEHEISELKSNLQSHSLQIRSVKKQNELLDKENRDLQFKNTNLDNTLKQLNRKIDNINTIIKDKETQQIVKNYINNINIVNNAIVEALNIEHYSQIDVIKVMMNIDKN